MPRTAVRGFLPLAFHGADGDALDEILLQEGVEQDDGAGGHHRHGQLHGLAGHLAHGQAAAGGRLGDGLGLGEDVVQVVLQRIQVAAPFVQKQHGVVPVVPVVEGDEQAHRGKACLAQRHGHPQVDGEVARAVQPGGFIQRLRDARHVAFQDEQVGHVDEDGQDEGDDAVVEVQVLGVEDVPGHEAAAEDGGEVEEEGHLIAVAEGAAGQHIGRHAGEQKAQEGAGGGDEDGHAVGPQQVARNFEQSLVGVQREGLGDEPVAVGEDGGLVGEGAADHQPEGQQAEEREHRQHGHREHVKDNAVPPHGLFAGFGLACHEAASFQNSA